MEKPNYLPPANVLPNATPPIKSRLPIAALIFTFVLPFVFYKASLLVFTISSSIPLISAFETVTCASSAFEFATVASPILGMLMAIISLCLGKKRIGKNGIAISILVLILPITGIAALLAFLSTVDFSHM